MKSEGGKGSFRTYVTKQDENTLRRLMRLLGPIAKETKSFPSLYAYKNMSRDDLWWELVVSVCVRGSARKIEALDKQEKHLFRQQLSLKRVMSYPKRKSYIEKALKESKATRFHRKSAETLAHLLKSPLLEMKGLDGYDDMNELREKIIACSGGCFRLKTASNFMISVGLSHDVVALDSRIVAMLKEHFDYTINGQPAQPAKVQSNRALYLSVEAELREVAKRAGESLALLDRVLFGFADYSSRYVWQRVAA